MARLRAREDCVNASNWFSSPLQGALIVGSFYLWGVIELVNTLVFGRRHRGGPDQDRGSYWAVLVTIYSAMVLALVMKGLRLGLLPTLFQWVGLALVWVGVLVRQWAIFSLGRAFTVVVEVNRNQGLITSGLYRWVRHPAYSGSIITLGGVGLAAGSWIGAMLALAIALAGYSYRVRVEERAMLEVFGDEYRNYMLRTGRFIPRVL
jgi:protein-S-isoprenylcysteine O-methyltransferase Ste14